MICSTRTIIHNQHSKIRVDRRPVKPSGETYHQNSSKVITVISVMEKRHVPIDIQTQQESLQGTGRFWEIKSEQPLVLDVGSATGHVSHVDLRELILAQIDARESVLLQVGHDALEVVRDVHHWLEGDHDVRLRRRVESVREFRHVAGPYEGVQGTEGSRAFGDGDGQCSFRSIRAFRHKSEAIEVHVGARCDGHQGLSLRSCRFHIFSHSGNSQSTGWFQHDSPANH